MKTEKPSSDPSMDEILASIRHIISSDPQKEEKSISPLKDEEDILDLTEALPEQTPPSASSAKVQEVNPSMDGKKEEPQQKLISSRKDETKHIPEEFSKPQPKSVLTPRNTTLEENKSKANKESFLNPVNEPSKKPEDTITQEFLSTPTFDEPLVSATAMSEAAQALHSLNKFAQERPKAPEPRLDKGIGGQTVENLVREILRPLLKEWLEANLPTLVRWVVNEQVEKIVRQLGVTPPESESDKPKHPPKF